MLLFKSPMQRYKIMFEKQTLYIKKTIPNKKNSERKPNAYLSDWNEGIKSTASRFFWSITSA